ncbi:MAG: hypothetical protein S4CHLAM6_15650 [Chlamydiae bacterium]|nr:hypothetical protein [Chlamydiota bacterium]
MISRAENSLNTAHVVANQEVEAPQTLTYGQKKPFPKHWGNPPALQTCDWTEFPEGYGNGSGSVRHWIIKNLELDSKRAEQQ